MTFLSHRQVALQTRRQLEQQNMRLLAEQSLQKQRTAQIKQQQTQIEREERILEDHQRLEERRNNMDRLRDESKEEWQRRAKLRDEALAAAQRAVEEQHQERMRQVQEEYEKTERRLELARQQRVEELQMAVKSVCIVNICISCFDQSTDCPKSELVSAPRPLAPLHKRTSSIVCNRCHTLSLRRTSVYESGKRRRSLLCCKRSKPSHF